MKIALRSNQDCFSLYIETAQAYWFAIRITALTVSAGLLLFLLGIYILSEGKQNTGPILPLVYGLFFLIRGMPMAINLPRFLARIKKENGAVILIANKKGLSIAPQVEGYSFYERATYSWDRIEKILCTRKSFAVEDNLGWDLMIFYLRDDPERKNKKLLERDIWVKNKEEISLPKFSKEKTNFIINELSRLSCEKVKFLYKKYRSL